MSLIAQTESAWYFTCSPSMHSQINIRGKPAKVVYSPSKPYIWAFQALDLGLIYKNYANTFLVFQKPKRTLNPQSTPHIKNVVL